MKKKALLVYYSYTGNTQRIAELIQKETGADLVRLEPATPYTGSYEAVVDQGKAEVESGFQPALQPLAVDVRDYDTVLVGTPTWWYTMAPAVLTFLRGQDWQGKTVIPFMTNAGWPGHVIEDMKRACAGASFSCEKELRFDAAGEGRLLTGEDELKNWLAAVKQAVT